MPVGAVAILTEGGGVTMPNTVAGAGKTRCSGSSGRAACAWWHMTVKQKPRRIGPEKRKPPAGMCAAHTPRGVHPAPERYADGSTAGRPPPGNLPS